MRYYIDKSVLLNDIKVVAFDFDETFYSAENMRELYLNYIKKTFKKLCGFDDKKTHAVIDKINKEFFYDIADDKRKSKIIDLYKSNDIVNMIESVIEKNDTCKISPCKDVEFSDTIKNGNL